jgi:hypothetical protein
MHKLLLEGSIEVVKSGRKERTNWGRNAVAKMAINLVKFQPRKFQNKLPSTPNSLFKIEIGVRNFWLTRVY